MSTVTNLPERILQRNAEVHLLRDILDSFDPTLFEKQNLNIENLLINANLVNLYLGINL